VLSALNTAHPDSRIELFLPDPPFATPATEHVPVQLAQSGFAPVERTLDFRRSLAGVSHPRRRRFTFRRFAEVGRAGLRVLLAHLWPDGFGPLGLTPAGELDEFLDLASPPGRQADTRLWRIAHLDGVAVGVILGLHPPVTPDTGVLLFIGLVPEARGRGLGTALHEEALWLLRGSGAAIYKDSAAETNHRMRRILDRAGCDLVGMSTRFERTPVGWRPDAEDRMPLRVPLPPHCGLLYEVRIGR
jgi:GNAT superfamily N-acetyltransferase